MGLKVRLDEGFLDSEDLRGFCTIAVMSEVPFHSRLFGLLLQP
jgi:hypothetical protein